MHLTFLGTPGFRGLAGNWGRRQEQDATLSIVAFLKKLFGGNRAKLKVLGKTTSGADGDRMLIDLMRKLDSNVNNPHTVQHFLYLPNEETAESAGGDLRALGYEVEITRSASPKVDDPFPWLVLASEGTLVNEKTVGDSRSQLEKVAEKFGGNYDGWEAAMPQ